MDRVCENNLGSDCPLRYVCRCLRVTEETLVKLVETEEIHTVKDIRRHTGAGDGCMACHKRLARFIPQPSLANAS
jgi:bacterioferritin-associated ferredoxin